MNIQRLILKLLAKLPDSLLIKLSGGKPFVVGGRTLDPMLQLIRAQGIKLPPVSTLTPEQARAAMDLGSSVMNPSPRPMETIEDVSFPGPGGEIPCRLLTPHGAKEPSPLILFFHQGGCVIGNERTCEPFCTILADEAHPRVLSVGYRLAPEHPFPAAAEDAIAAYHYAVDHAEDWGIDPRCIIVAGDSAGAGLATVIAQWAREEEIPAPFLQVLIYPWVDALADNDSYREHEEAYPLNKATMHWFASHYFTDEDQRGDYRASPARNPDLSGLPRSLIYTAGFDPLRDEGKAYSDALRDAGVDVSYRCFDSLAHSFLFMGGVIPAALDACHLISEDIHSVLSESRSD